MPEHTIKNLFDRLDADRNGQLELLRHCAALTKPWVMPPQSQKKNEELPEAYQSLGPRGITNLEGQMILAMFPPDHPWFTQEVDPELRYDPTADKSMIHDIEQRLFMRSLAAQATLESADAKPRSNDLRVDFRSRARMAITQILITGEALMRLTPDYRLRVFRRTSYVNKRDTTGDILYHVVREQKDPLNLTDDEFAKTGLNRADVEKKRADERLEDLYTHYEWNPQSRKWVIRQEINENTVFEDEDDVPQFFSVPFELVPEEDYGRGFVELNKGDLNSHNELREKMLDFAGLHSKQTPAKDYTSQVKDSDFAKKSGEPITCRVRQGIAEDVAWLSPNNAANFRVVAETDKVIHDDLAAAMLIASEVQPFKERVTATQIQSIVNELEGALGGFYAPVADEFQLPLIRRTLWQLEDDGILEPLPSDSVKIRINTGVTALSRERDGQRLMAAVQQIAQIPGAAARINMDVLVDLIARFAGIDEPDLIKSPEEVQEQQAQAAQQQLAMQAGEQAIESAGRIAESQATQSDNGNAQEQ